MRITHKWAYGRLKIHDKESENFPFANISRQPSSITSYLNRLSLKQRTGTENRYKKSDAMVLGLVMDGGYF